MLSKEVLNSANRKELQKLAKEYGIKANLSSDALRDALLEVLEGSSLTRTDAVPINAEQADEESSHPEDAVVEPVEPSIHTSQDEEADPMGDAAVTANTGENDSSAENDVKEALEGPISTASEGSSTVPSQNTTNTVSADANIQRTSPRKPAVPKQSQTSLHITATATATATHKTTTTASAGALTPRSAYKAKLLREVDMKAKEKLAVAPKVTYNSILTGEKSEKEHQAEKSTNDVGKTKSDAKAKTNKADGKKKDNTLNSKTAVRNTTSTSLATSGVKRKEMSAAPSTAGPVKKPKVNSVKSDKQGDKKTENDKKIVKITEKDKKVEKKTEKDQSKEGYKPFKARPLPSYLQKRKENH